MDTKMWLRGLILISLHMPLLAIAALGSSPESVSSPRPAAKASSRSAVSGGTLPYSVQQSDTAAGTAIREYVRSDGKVFAVFWEGPVQPNLKQYLGTYFQPYVDTARISRSGHRHLAVKTADVVVQSSGHMRAFSGRAYIPQMLPKGITIDELE